VHSLLTFIYSRHIQLELIQFPGSLAAGIQSLIYGGATGGLFPLLQSLGATAVVAPHVVLGIGAALVVIGGVLYVVTKVKERKAKQKND